MENLFNYVDKYGDISFDIKEFNDIDNIVFSSISYLNFSNTCINKGIYTIEQIADDFIKKNKYKDISKIGIAQKDGYNLLKIIKDKSRYKDIILEDYVYTRTKNMQFSALTFNISKKLKYISFEGTDESISGWKEDSMLSCTFPIPSQIKAIEYVNKHVDILGSNVIIGGHSKGGNLALVSGMYMKKYKKFKVKKIYNNDGPGLRKNEFNSREYKNIRKKYIHIIPDSSIVGVLLLNDTYKVVKSNKKSVFSHAISSWVIKDDEFVLSNLSLKSKKLEKSIMSWLDKHDDNMRRHAIRTIFKVLEDAKIDELNSVRDIRNMIKIIYNIRNIDKSTKDIVIEFINYNYKNIL